MCFLSLKPTLVSVGYESSKVCYKPCVESNNETEEQSFESKS